jgi:hypothetical protein
MFQTDFEMRMAAREREMLPAHTPEEAARLALGRVRKALTDCKPGLIFDPARLRLLLETPLPGPAQEIERLFSLGWLAWLASDPACAVELLTEAFNRCPRDGTNDWYAQSAYWRTRVRLLLHQPEALADYETVLRTLKGSPQGTAWFVDLLWRAGRVDRAEQVWKSVRANKKVLACEEGPLLEARSLLRRGELPSAEKVLTEATPVNGVVQVERCLLLAWIATTQKQPQKAADLLAQADRGPYPAGARERWRRLLTWRNQATGVADEAELQSPLLRDLARGQQARLEGNLVEASAALQQARGNSVSEPFARYALACLGKDDPAALLAGQPGLFLAVRCRVRQMVERFRTRQASTSELLDALHSSSATKFSDPSVEHFRQITQLLQRRDPSVDDLRGVVSQAPVDPAQRRNLFRAALETAVRRLPIAAQRELLLEWARLPWLEAEPELRALLARPLLRLVLQQGTTESTERDLVESLHPEEPLLAMLRPAPESAGGPGSSASPPVALLQAARSLAGKAVLEGDAAATWRDQVRRLGETGRWRGLAQALLVQESARRGDVGAVAALLDETDRWRGFRQGPPRFVLRALVALVSRQPAHPAWKRSLPRWLQLWDPSALGSEGQTLSAQAGLSSASALGSPPPPGVPAVAWSLHLAARALDNPSEALACVRRALAAVPELAGLPEANLVREALPQLERRALARSLGLLVCPEGNQGPTEPGLLVDAIDLLRSFPDGLALLEAMQQGDANRARAVLDNLLRGPGIPPRLQHHLALLELHTAREMEEAEQTEQASPSWRNAWQAWLRWLAEPAASQITEEDRSLLLDWLLGLHRSSVNELLARGEVDRARRHWDLVQELPERARSLSEDLGQDLSQRLSRFRDDLAGEYLVTTREAMRYGTIAEGMHADYEKGLTYLRRLLSLDKDNVRLLTALVEVCGEYFLDLYHAGSPPALIEQVERFTPFALQLARLVESQPGALAARAALAEFYKFRGFVTRDREQKLAMYREALRFNPGNENVRNLLNDLEAPAEEEGT